MKLWCSDNREGFPPSLDSYELTAEANSRHSTAVEAPSVRVVLLKSRIVDFLGFGVGNLSKNFAVLGRELSGEDCHSYIFRTFYNLCTNAVALTLGDLDRELLPPPSPDHIFQIGRESGST